MPPVKFTEVLSFSSEDPNHPADNLLRPDTFRKWKCAAGLSEKQAFVILKLEKLTSIHSVDIGNEGSAFVEVLVAREGGDFQVLLVASSFMTPSESRAGNHLSRVRMFGSDKLNKTVAEQKWDRLKVICTQPFNKTVQYGLSFITVTAYSEESSSSTSKSIKLGSFTLKEEDDSDPISVGSVFARRKDSETSSPLTGAAAIRAASASAAAAAGASPSVESEKKPHNIADIGFYQLKKNSVQEKESSKTSQSSKHSASPSDSTPSRKHSDKNREREEKRKNHEGKHEGAHKKRKGQDDRDEKNRDNHRKDREQEKRKQESDKKREDPKVTQKKHQKNDDTKSASSSKVSSKRKTAPFSALMKDVSFVLSGYQNPQRSQIRDMMIEMGAKYKPDWDPSCTHLICAFSNTPKYQQVKGKGRIVTAKWTFECHKNKIRYPCKRYALDKQKNAEDSEEEIWAEELLPKEEKTPPKPVKPTTNKTSSDIEDSDHGSYSDGTYSDNEDTDDEIQRVLAKQKIKGEETSAKDKTSSKVAIENSQKTTNKKRKLDDAGEKQNLIAKNNKRKSIGGEDVKGDMNGTDDNIYDDDTDIDEENKVHLTRPDTSALPLPSLEDYFCGKFFFIYGNMSTEMKQLLSRYIVAFDGTLEDYMTDKVNFVVTEDEWDENFDEALADNPSIQFVKPAWIWRCSDKRKIVPFQPFMVVPKD